VIGELAGAVDLFFGLGGAAQQTWERFFLFVIFCQRRELVLKYFLPLTGHSNPLFPSLAES
jgi:hypothetical protein